MDDRAADAVFAPMPLLATRQPQWWVMPLVVIVPLVMLAGKGARWWHLVGIVGLSLLWWSPVSMWYRSGRRERDRLSRPETAGADWRARAACRLVRELERYKPWTWEQFEESREAAGLGPLRAIVDRQLEEALRAIAPPQALLEPEPFVVSAPAMPRRRVLMGYGALAAVCGVIAVRGAVRQEFLPALAGAGMAVVFLLGLPAVRRLGVVPDSPPVAGVGFVGTADGRRWTTFDAVLLVSTAFYGGLDALLVGRAGRLAMTFMGPDDENFVMLWQRWMHPAPRPELAAPG